jgi:hypothetical protein
MQSVIIGIIVLVLGFFIGKLLAWRTKEELEVGQKWFKLIVLVSILGAIVSLFLNNDPLLFGFLFILVITSRSIKQNL